MEPPTTDLPAASREDNPVNLEVGVGILEGFGCNVETATNGVEALALHNQREFDIIFITTGGGPDRATETLAVRIYQEAFTFFRMGTASALGVLTMVLAALLALASMRTLRREYF